jgi:hypothetical protein
MTIYNNAAFVDLSGKEAALSRKSNLPMPSVCLRTDYRRPVWESLVSVFESHHSNVGSYPKHNAGSASGIIAPSVGFLGRVSGCEL